MRAPCQARHPFDLQADAKSAVGSAISVKTALTEHVDAPDDTLREDLVLVESDERTEGSRGKEREGDAVARTVAVEDL